MVGYGGGLGLLPLNVGMAAVRYAAAYRVRKDSGRGDEEVGRGRKRREYTKDTSEEGFLLPPCDGVEAGGGIPRCPPLGTSQPSFADY
jgi:hypothetical protein